MERSLPPRVARPYRITLHMWYRGPSCTKHRLSWCPATWQVPLHCPRLRVHCQVGQSFVLAEWWRREWRRGKTAEAEGRESRLSSAQPGDRWFWEQVRAMVKPALPSHHIARSQAQVSFGHVRRGMLGHTTPYYRPRRIPLCEVDHLSLLPSVISRCWCQDDNLDSKSFLEGSGYHTCMCSWGCWPSGLLLKPCGFTPCPRFRDPVSRTPPGRTACISLLSDLHPSMDFQQSQSLSFP